MFDNSYNLFQCYNSITAGRNQNGKQEIFKTNSNLQVDHVSQAPSGWNSVDLFNGSSVPLDDSHIGVSNYADGTLVVFVKSGPGLRPISREVFMKN